MITRIVQHNVLSFQEQEDYLLKFEGEMVKIHTKEGLVGGLAKDHHSTLIEIYNNSSIFILEEVAVKYRDSTIEFVKSLFNYYEQIELGMLYMDVIGNENKNSIYGQRYAAATIMNNKPPVAFVNKKLCPGLPTSLNQSLLAEIVQKSPVLYYPGEYMDLI